MIKLKMTYVCNQCLYILMAIGLLLILFIQFSYMILIIFLFYLIFIIKKNRRLIILIVLLSICYYLKSKNDFDHIYTKIDPNFTCQIISIPTFKDSKHRFYCRNNTQKVLVEYQDETVQTLFKIGQIVEVHGDAYVVKRNTVPNLFNFANYYLSKQVGFRVYVDQVEIKKDEYQIKDRLINFILNYYKDIKHKEYVYALLIGSRDEFSDEFNDQIKYLNISHLFVVSGFHVNFIYLIIKNIMKYCRVTKERSELLTGLFLIFFMILNNYGVSVVRAVFFILLVMVKKRFHFNIHNVHLLSFIALFHLFINPFILFDPGFQLSYLITFILLLSQSILSRQHPFLLPLYISLIAQVSSLPITSNFNFHYNFLSILVSPILGWYYTFIIFPSSLLLSLFKNLDSIFSYFFTLFEITIQWLNQIKLFEYNIGCFTVLRAFIYYILIFYILKKLELTQTFKKILVFFCLILLLYHKISLVDEVTFIDVGQGDSTLIKSDLKRCRALIDTGGIGNFFTSRIHPGERHVLPYLQSMQIRQLDYLFISHSDADHAGDYQYILDHMNVKNIVLNQFEKEELSQEIIETAKMKGINVILVHAYTKIRCGDIEFHVLNPLYDNNTSNDNSLVLFFVFNGHQFLFTGDISTSVEEELIQKYQLKIDFLKVSHHGSKYATSEALLSNYQVQYGIISVGKNVYNHPTSDVLNRFKQLDIPYYRTDLDGTIRVKYYIINRSIIRTYSPHNNNA